MSPGEEHPRIFDPRMTKRHLRDDWCFWLEAAYLVSRVLPRGKGASARFIGKWARPWIHHTLRTRHGALLPIHAECLDVFTTMRGQGNAFDYWVLRVLNALTADGQVVHDVGANVGYLSVELAALRRADDVKVVSFERQAALAQGIVQAVALNGLGNLSVESVALGDADQTVGLAMHPHSLHRQVSTESDDGYPLVDVDQHRLDTLVTEGRVLPPDVMKIDTEGYELSVLHGASDTISRFRPAIVFEVSSDTLRRGIHPGAIVEHLLGLADYAFFKINGTAQPRDWAEAYDGRGHLDVIACTERHLPAIDAHRLAEERRLGGSQTSSSHSYT